MISSVNLQYRISPTRDIHHYECSPELVIFDAFTQETLLLPDTLATIYTVFNASVEKQKSMEDIINSLDLSIEDIASIAILEESLDNLVLLNLIEPIV